VNIAVLATKVSALSGQDLCEWCGCYQVRKGCDFHAFLISCIAVMRYNAGKTGRLKSSIQAVLEGRDGEFFFAVSAAV
jgi:hypothetical protein